ncbi:uncharacterized protein LOC131428610 [Malaya genurostris]|uniref:uncharacterized protein LOC131428610 n=1 Tax=Malaya genurostris TaxID=325434 RepID=UPI0026F3DC44|nr:uncharacterized protein LOC131428610 [Malaya genurostris]
MDELKELKKQERQLRTSMKAIAKFVQGFRKEVHEKQVDVRLETLENAMRKFYTVRRKIELIIDEEDEKPDLKESAEQRVERLESLAIQREDEYDEAIRVVEEEYFEIKSSLIMLRARSSLPARQTSANEDATVPISRVKLPDIKLPSFGGKLKDWVTFRDSFRSLIHNNRQLEDVDKFIYLRSSVTGEAFQEICSVELSADNYEIAWKMLEKKFENKKLIVKAHLDALFSIEPMRKESCDALNNLISEFDRNLQMLAKIGENPANWSTLLAHMVCSRLDTVTIRQWETHHNSKDVPSYENLIAFLRDQCTVLQSISSTKHSADDSRRTRISATHTSTQSSKRCLFCGESFHLVFRCNKFRMMTVAQRVEDVNRKRLCRNCLSSGHYADSCLRGSCNRCGDKHHTLLHYESTIGGTRPVKSTAPPAQVRPHTADPQPQQTKSNPQSQRQHQLTQTPTQVKATTSHPVIRNDPQTTHSQPTTDQKLSATFKAVTQATPTKILMSTAIIRVEDQFGNSSFARTLLDSCSEFCYMTTSFSNRLKFRESPSFLRVQGIGNGTVTSTKFVTAIVQPRLPLISNYTETMQFHILPKITRFLPISSVQIDLRHLPSEIVLADPSYGKPGPIDMIIGAECYYDLLSSGKKKLSKDGPILQESVFGWIISGKVPCHLEIPKTSTYISSTTDLHELISRFWELETCHVNSTHSIEETACEELFNKTTVRDAVGKFVVTLPRKQHVIAKLGESKTIANKRFLGLERRLNANLELKALYREFIHEYLLMGHMKEISDESCDESVYYMPHHAVLKPDSTTTKLRVVFDGSCRTTTGISLNDALMVGPVVQDDLISIITRFRLHRFALVADIAKMYRMIRVQPSDQHLQRILWRESAEEPVKTFELTTVTYGTASAPYLATKCLTKLGKDSEATHPVAARVIQKDFYVDDMLSGADSLEEANVLISEVMEVTSSAGFTLRKWNSNAAQLLSKLPKQLLDERSALELDSSSATVKTLGLLWDTSTDSFCFNFPQWRSTSVAITKRSIHSDAACLFDPLGLVGPVIVQAKIFIQQLWRLKCGWDDPLEDALQEVWKEYKQNLMALDSLSVPRWIGRSSEVVEVQLHGFCGASEVAYGAVLYLRCMVSDGTITSRLITSKSRVAPMENLKAKKRKVSIPRLELSSALLLSHLYERFSRISPVRTVFLWTDSMIVKHWLASQPSRWQAFVANRVSEIQHLTKNSIWNHVPGIENPADLISRGISPAQLQYKPLWFNGPTWLSQARQYWPTAVESKPEDIEPTLLEERTSLSFPSQAIPPSAIFELRSSYTELVRLVAFILRFRFNAQCCNRAYRKTGSISHNELEQAVLVLVRLSQRECFAAELCSLSKNGQVHEGSKIVGLHPCLSPVGILCVGGRLHHAPISVSRKHPFILDGRHLLAMQIVRHYHLRLFHAGQQLLIASVRERFWPTAIHNLVRRVIHDCVPCFRRRPKVLEQLMADLPPERVTPSSPFLKVGVDYCGPFLISYPNRRTSPVKSYVAIFVCLAVKAVHLELVADLTTQAFLAALKRFVARRGKPQLIMCDNATTFVGAKRELKELFLLFNGQQFQDIVTKDAGNDSIEFRFIPPRTPNFGGLWEAQVKSFKNHFKKTIGLRTLNIDEMLTVLAQIEAILNSRPLTPVSSDPNDFEALTPGHFLVHRPLTAIPEPNLQDIPTNRMSMWQRAQSLIQQMWKKWSTQYLSDLHNRTRWTKQRDNVAEGTMVLLKDENAPPQRWNLGRVVKVFYGTDGNIRVVSVRTKDGCFDRGISKLCVLPIRDNVKSPSTDRN